MRRSAISGKLRQVLDSYRVRWRAMHSAVGLLLTLCALVAGVGLAVLVDRALLGAPKPLRLAFFAAIAGTALYILLRKVIVPIAKRMSDERTAARLGRHFPDAAEDLVTGVELSRPEDSAGVSKALVAEALHQIDERAGAIRYRAALPFALLQKTAAALALLALGMVAAYLHAPEAVSNSIERLVRVDRDVPFFSYTRLELLPGNCVVRQADPFHVQLTVGGPPVAKAWLDLRPARSAGRDRQRADSFSVELPVAAGRAEWQSGPLSEDLNYRARAGDALTPWFSVRAVPAPSVMTKSVRISLPAYTARPDPITVPAIGPVSVLQGSTVVIQIKPVHRGDDPLLACSGVLSDGKENTPLSPDASGDLVSPSLAPKENMDYKVLLTDRLGLVARTWDTVSLKMVPDALPVVFVSKPGMDLAVLPDESVNVAIEAQDDYGCRELNLRTRVIRGTAAQAAETPAAPPDVKWDATPLKPGGPTVLRLEAAQDLSLSELGLAPGDRIEYQGESSDFEDEAVFRKSRSPVYHITVLSYSEHMMAIFNRLREISLQVQAAAARQNAEAEETSNLANTPEKTDVASPATAAQEREADLRSSVEQTSREMAAVMTEMARNPETMANLVTEADRLRHEMEETSEQPMKSAEDKLGKAAQSAKPSAASEANQSSSPQEDLKDAANAQQKAADELARMAAELRRLQHENMLDLLADAAEKLGTQQKENRELTAKTGVALNGRPPAALPAEDRAKLDRVVAEQKQIAEGVATLNKDIEKAGRLLSTEQASEADRTSDALDKMRADQAVESSAAVTKQLAQGVLFAQLPKQANLANSLDNVADILRTSDDMDALGKQLEEFIKRQKAMNAGMEKLVAGDLPGADASAPPPKRRAGGSDAWSQPQPEPSETSPVKAVSNRLGARQGVLAEDVTEHSLAMGELFKQFNLFSPETTDKLNGAAHEMNLATQQLNVPTPPAALERGRKALALLEDAVKALLEDQRKANLEEMNENPDAMDTESLMLLAKILGGQKLLNSDTAATDRLRNQPPDSLADRIMGLARRQSRLGFDAGRLVRRLARMPHAAAVVNMAGKNMAISRTDLEAGDTGQQTRVVQHEVVALLGQLLEDQQHARSHSSQAEAAMAMMARTRPGGFTGGTNSPLMPATLDSADDDAWTKMRSRFEGNIGSGFDAQYPPEFRGLLNSYFDQVRKEAQP